MSSAALFCVSMGRCMEGLAWPLLVSGSRNRNISCGQSAFASDAYIDDGARYVGGKSGGHSGLNSNLYSKRVYVSRRIRKT